MPREDAKRSPGAGPGRNWRRVGLNETCPEHERRETQDDAKNRHDRLGDRRTIPQGVTSSQSGEPTTPR